MQDDEFLIKEEVAEILRISVRSVTRLLNQRKLPHTKVGRRALIKRSDVMKFLRAGRVA